MRSFWESKVSIKEILHFNHYISLTLFVAFKYTIKYGHGNSIWSCYFPLTHIKLSEEKNFIRKKFQYRIYLVCICHHIPVAFYNNFKQQFKYVYVAWCKWRMDLFIMLLEKKMQLLGVHSKVIEKQTPILEE